MPRNQMIGAIDLKNCLQMGNSTDKGLFVLTQLEEVEILLCFQDKILKESDNKR